MIEKSGLAAIAFTALVHHPPLRPLALTPKPPQVSAAPKLPPRSVSPMHQRPAVKEVVLDSRQCRIWLNEAQREIDRLRRGLATPLPPHPHRGCDDDSPCDLASPPKPGERKTYAVDPIGTPPAPREKPPATEPGAKVITRPHVTNVGSVLDVLA